MNGRAALAAAMLIGSGCAAARTICPTGTAIGHQVFSGGGEAEWCRRPDGAREGAEARYDDAGSRLVTGSYADGAQDGIWRYRFGSGRNWRAERWDDGALVQVTVDPAVARLTPAQLAALDPPSTSGVIKLASHDPIPGREAREGDAAPSVTHYLNGRLRAAGRYDAQGLRLGVWQFWFEDGHPARQVEFVDGVREREVRAWHPNGTLAVEGAYRAGQREGRWRFWDAAGHLTAEIVYRAGAPVDLGMLPAGP